MLIKRQTWQPFTVRSLPWCSLTGLHVEHGSIILSYCERQSSPEQLKNPVDCKNKQTNKPKNDTALDDKIALEDELKIPDEKIECIFWQTSISDQRQKLKCMNK